LNYSNVTAHVKKLTPHGIVPICASAKISVIFGAPPACAVCGLNKNPGWQRRANGAFFPIPPQTHPNTLFQGDRDASD
jgi:hypothetical protein